MSPFESAYRDGKTGARGFLATQWRAISLHPYPSLRFLIYFSVPEAASAIMRNSSRRSLSLREGPAPSVASQAVVSLASGNASDA